MINVEQVLTKKFRNKLNDYYFNRLLNIAEKRNWFTKKLIREIAYFVGKVSGDGNLDHSFIVRLLGQRNDLAKIKSEIMENFNIEPYKIKLRQKIWENGKCHILQVNDTCFGRLLYSFGAPQGNKTKTLFSVPRWILNSDKITKKHYLQALLEDELSTIKIEKATHSNKPYFKMSKSEKLLINLVSYVKQIKSMLEEFGIECSSLSKPFIENIKENDITITVYFCINRNKKNIMKFARTMGFKINQSKINNLNNCYNTLKSSLNR